MKPAWMPHRPPFCDAPLRGGAGDGSRMGMRAGSRLRSSAGSSGLPRLRLSFGAGGWGGSSGHYPRRRLLLWPVCLVAYRGSARRLLRTPLWDESCKRTSATFGRWTTRQMFGFRAGRKIFWPPARGASVAGTRRPGHRTSVSLLQICVPRMSDRMAGLLVNLWSLAWLPLLLRLLSLLLLPRCLWGLSLFLFLARFSPLLLLWARGFLLALRCLARPLVPHFRWALVCLPLLMGLCLLRDLLRLSLVALMAVPAFSHQRETGRHTGLLPIAAVRVECLRRRFQGCGVTIVVVLSRILATHCDTFSAVYVLTVGRLGLPVVLFTFCEIRRSLGLISL